MTQKRKSISFIWFERQTCIVQCQSMHHAAACTIEIMSGYYRLQGRQRQHHRIMRASWQTQTSLVWIQLYSILALSAARNCPSHPLLVSLHINIGRAINQDPATRPQTGSKKLKIAETSANLHYIPICWGLPEFQEMFLRCFQSAVLLPGLEMDTGWYHWAMMLRMRGGGHLAGSCSFNLRSEFVKRPIWTN